jgi:hypothetical protein
VCVAHIELIVIVVFVVDRICSRDVERDAIVDVVTDMSCSSASSVWTIELVVVVV